MSLSPEELTSAIAGDQVAVRRFVEQLAPIIQVRTGRVMLRHRRNLSGQEVRQETEDLCQETLAHLFASGAQVLKNWDAQKGLSLENFVGLISERVAYAWMRTGRKSAWREQPMGGEDLKRMADRRQPELTRGTGSLENRAESRNTLERVLERLKEELPPNGLQVFYMIYARGKSSKEVCETMNLKPETVYSWRSRLMKKARAIKAEIDAEVKGTPEGVAR